MNAMCPHCKKVIVITVGKDSNVGKARTPDTDASSLGELLDLINDAALEGRALEFVASTRERFEEYGAKTRMSEAQLAWLNDIVAEQTGEKSEW